MKIDTAINFRKNSNIFRNLLNYYKVKVISLFFLSILSLSFVLFSFYYTFNIFYIHGVSMQPTLNANWVQSDDSTRDLAVVRPGGNVERGDIIVTRLVDGGSYLVIKRLIAVGGDVIFISENSETGRADFFVNGKKIDQSFVVNDRSYEDTLAKFNALECVSDGVLVVPYDRMFYLGDNRTSSVDSLTRGCDKKSLIYGKLVESVPHDDNFISHIFKRLPGNLTIENLKRFFRVSIF